MGIDKRLMKLWVTRREDVITAYEVLAELGRVSEDHIKFMTETLDRFVAANPDVDFAS